MDKRNRKKKTVDDTVCEIHKFSGYAVLSNCFVRSTKLGCPAIGLLGRVMDLPPTWIFSKAGLIALCPDGETAIDSALKNLKECGYLEIEVKMPNENPTGRIQTVYKFYEYSAKDTSIPQYDYELETFTVDNAVFNRVKKVGNFTMISSKLLRNKEIPNKLLGFLLKVLSLPDYWHFSMSGLKAICKEGKTAVHNAVNKLIDMGYLVRTQLLSNESIHNCYEYDDGCSVIEKMPLLSDLQRELKNEGEVALRVSNSLEMFVNGSQNLFNHRTNIDMTNRIICFDIKELGNQLKKVGMLIVQDTVWNRVSANREKKKITRYYIDEFHLLLKEEQTAKYSAEIWKRFRKWGGVPTGITQNVKDLLSSQEVENIFDNSDFVYMLNQAAGDRDILAEKLHISKEQMKYVTNSGPGEGLIRYDKVLLPFTDRFPTDTQMYRLMTTKPTEE